MSTNTIDTFTDESHCAPPAYSLYNLLSFADGVFPDDEVGAYDQSNLETLKMGRGGYDHSNLETVKGLPGYEQGNIGSVAAM